MNAKLLPSKRSYLAGLLGATVLIVAPSLARADQGKWWTPKERGPRPVVERGRNDRSMDRGSRRGIVARRGWYGGPVIRDRVVIRGGYGGPYFRARRYYVRPCYQRRVVFVRPVRYFITADMCLHGLSVSARFHSRDHYEYGCNFCDARFDDYDDYAAHVGRCAYAPEGYQIAPRGWDDRYSNDDWNSRTDDGFQDRFGGEDRIRSDEGSEE